MVIPREDQSIFALYRELKLAHAFGPAVNVLGIIEAKLHDFSSIKQWCKRERAELTRVFYACAIDENFNRTCFPEAPFKNSAIIREKLHEMHRVYMTNYLSNFLRTNVFDSSFSFLKSVRRISVISDDLGSTDICHLNHFLNYLYWQGSVRISTFALSVSSGLQSVNSIFNGSDVIILSSLSLLSSANLSKAISSLKRKIPVFLWVKPSDSIPDIRKLIDNIAFADAISQLHLIASNEDQKKIFDTELSPLTSHCVPQPIISNHCHYDFFKGRISESKIFICDFTGIEDIDIDAINTLALRFSKYKIKVLGVPPEFQPRVNKDIVLLDRFAPHFLMHEFAQASLYVACSHDLLCLENALNSYLCGCKLYINQNSNIPEQLRQLSGVHLFGGDLFSALPSMFAEIQESCPASPSDMSLIADEFGLSSHLKSLFSVFNHICNASDYEHTTKILDSLYENVSVSKICVIAYLKGSERLIEFSRILGSLQQHNVTVVVVVSKSLLTARFRSDIEFFVGQRADGLKIQEATDHLSNWNDFCEIILGLNAEHIYFDFLLNIDLEYFCELGCFDSRTNNYSAIESLLGSPQDIATIFSFLSQDEIDLVGPRQLTLLSDARRQQQSDPKISSPSIYVNADPDFLFNSELLPSFWIDYKALTEKIVPIVSAALAGKGPENVSMLQTLESELIPALSSWLGQAYKNTFEICKSINSSLISLKPFKGLHKNSDIYILCSGPSLELIHSSFFEGKVTIGINSVSRVRNVTYALFKEYVSVELEEHVVSNCSAVFASHFKAGSKEKGTVMKNSELFRSSRIIYFDHVENNLSEVDFDVVRLDSLKLVVSWSSVTSAIHLAWFMGAKNIILVGHDCGVINGKINIDGYSSRSDGSIDAWGGDSEKYRKWLSRIEKQTADLRDVLREKFGVNVYSLNPYVSLSMEGNSFSR